MRNLGRVAEGCPAEGGPEKGFRRNPLLVSMVPMVQTNPFGVKGGGRKENQTCSGHFGCGCGLGFGS